MTTVSWGCERGKKLLENLNSNQKEAIRFGDGVCSVIASPGSGKTEVLARRIEYLIKEKGAEPEHILALTFSVDAQLDMESRVKEYTGASFEKALNYGCGIRTFHSLGYHIIGRYSVQHREYKNLSRKILGTNNDKRKYLPKNSPKDILMYISEKKKNLEPPKKNSKDPHESAYYEYENKKYFDDVLDYDDLIFKSYFILKEDRRVLEFFNKWVDYILVDEMQDTSHAQNELLKLIAGEKKNVFMLGDPKQAIYGWRGGSNRYLVDVEKEWGKEAQTISLDLNYRSSKNIVSFVNHFAETLDESKNQNYKEIIETKPEYKDPVYTEYKTLQDEGKGVVKKIRKYKKDEGFDYGDFAVLARTNSGLANCEIEFLKSGIPYVNYGARSFLEIFEVQIVLNYLRIAHNHSDDYAFRSVYNFPYRNLNQHFLDKLQIEAYKKRKCLFDTMKSFLNVSNSVGVESFFKCVKSIEKKKYDSVADLVEFIRKTLNLDLIFNKNYCSDLISECSAMDNLDILEDIARNYSTLDEFISIIDKQRYKNENKNPDNSVKLMTVHKSKGLEFPVVFIAGVNEGVFPHRRSNSIEEERRLMYVGISRAEKVLEISSAQSIYNRPIEKSKFIYDLFE